MQSRDFCYWLQGFFEVQSVSRDEAQRPERDGLTPEQVSTIRNHLNMVFLHEIDPSMGGPDKQQALSDLHNNPHLTQSHVPGQIIARC